MYRLTIYYETLSRTTWSFPDGDTIIQRVPIVYSTHIYSFENFDDVVEFIKSNEIKEHWTLDYIVNSYQGVTVNLC